MDECLIAEVITKIGPRFKIIQALRKMKSEKSTQNSRGSILQLDQTDSVVTHAEGSILCEAGDIVFEGDIVLDESSSLVLDDAGNMVLGDSGNISRSLVLEKPTNIVLEVGKENTAQGAAIHTTNMLVHSATTTSTLASKPGSPLTTKSFSYDGKVCNHFACVVFCTFQISNNC